MRSLVAAFLVFLSVFSSATTPIEGVVQEDHIDIETAFLHIGLGEEKGQVLDKCASEEALGMVKIKVPILTGLAKVYNSVISFAGREKECFSGLGDKLDHLGQLLAKQENYTNWTIVDRAISFIKDEIFNFLLKLPELRFEPPSLGIDIILEVLELGQAAVAENLMKRVPVDPEVFLGELDRFDRAAAPSYRIRMLASLSTFMLPSIDLLDYAKIIDRAVRILQGRSRSGPYLDSLHSDFIDWIRRHSNEQIRHLLQDCQEQEDQLLVVSGWLEAFLWDDLPETSDISKLFVAAIREKDLGRAIAVLKQGNLSDDLVMLRRDDIKFCRTVLDELFEVYDRVKDSDVIGKISLSKSIMNLLRIPSIKDSYSNIDSISYAIVNGNEQLTRYLVSQCPLMVFNHSTMDPLHHAIVEDQQWAIDLLLGKYFLDLNEFKWIIQQWSISAKPATILTLIFRAKELFKDYSHQQHLILIDYVLYLMGAHLKVITVMLNAQPPALIPDLDLVVWNHYVVKISALKTVGSRQRSLQRASRKFSDMLQCVHLNIKGLYLSEWEARLCGDLIFASRSGHFYLAILLNSILHEA